MIRLGQDVLDDARVALASEWLLANGLGGSSSGTAAGIPTRLTHAHLIFSGAHGRQLALLLRLDERLLGPEGPYELSRGLQADGSLRPNGHSILEEFRLDPGPTWRYRAAGIRLEKSLIAITGHHAIAIAYRLLDGPEALLTVSPLLAARDPETPAGGSLEAAGVQAVPGRVRIELGAKAPTLSLWHDGVFMPARARQRLHVLGEGESVLAEDALVVGYFEATLTPGATLHLIASAEDDLMRALAREDRLGTPPPRTLAACVKLIERDERWRATSWKHAALSAAAVTIRQAGAARQGGAEVSNQSPPPLDHDDPIVPAAAEALRRGLTRRGHRVTLLTALPGGVESTTDTLRALGGLVSLRGFEAAREVLRNVIEYLNEGLAPEAYDFEDGTPRYGDPAPSLWLAIAGELYARRSQDLEFARAVLYPAIESVIHFYRSGTHGVRIDADGLLAVGEGSGAIKPAVLNALWYHAEVATGQLARAIGRKENGAFHLAWAHEHQRRFNEALWDEERGCLYRALAGERPVRGLDPSQLLAVSLPPSILTQERALRLVSTIERELFTPFGLRETSTGGDGGPAIATAWLGAFHSAYLRAHGRSAEAQSRVRHWLDPVSAALDAELLGILPVAFVPDSGMVPPPALGADRSILAMAELARVWVEELVPAEATAEV